MRPVERSPWSLLTPAQDKMLTEALLHPARAGIGTVEAYREIGTEFAVRSAHLLISNDLRGALDHAEIARVATVYADQQERRFAEMEERIRAQREAEAKDPRGRLVTVPGKKRRVRVFPADESQRAVIEIEQSTAATENKPQRAPRHEIERFKQA